MPNGQDFQISGKRVWVAGHRGMVGSALVRRLEREDCELLTIGRDRLDLRRQAEVEAWMAQAKADVVFLAAAKVGGILANTEYPGTFLYDNLMIEANVMEAARRNGVERLVFLGSSCIYPRLTPQPIREDSLLTGPLEPTNEPYAIAKIAGIKLAQSFRMEHGCRFISAQPANVYGPGDNFDLQKSHVIPALIRKAHEAAIAGASEMVVWGSGTPFREFVHVDDLADALVFLAKNYDGADIVNVGTGEEITIRALAELICGVVGFEGELRFDASRPDGTPRKVVDISRLKALGWQPAIDLADGIASTLEWYASAATPRL
ncbi:MAG: GDP-L-fucose synthase [Bauldia sp.]